MASESELRKPVKCKTILVCTCMIIYITMYGKVYQEVACLFDVAVVAVAVVLVGGTPHGVLRSSAGGGGTRERVLVESFSQGSECKEWIGARENEVQGGCPKTNMADNFFTTKKITLKRYSLVRGLVVPSVVVPPSSSPSSTRTMYARLYSARVL